jgi:hypothetical protein
MEAHGHHVISEVGERLLKNALQSSNPSRRMRLGAFYLGNWLTDVSQAVDPVAYRNAQRKLAGLSSDIDRLFERMITDAPSWVQEALDTAPGRAALGNVRGRLADARQRLEDSISGLIGQGRSGELADAFRAVFKGVGYYKFVLDDQGRPDGMHEGSYFAVFDRRYTQYYPHEHLDRPEEGGVYSRAKSSEALNGRARSVLSAGDLYTYLRKDIKVAAGLLAYLDGGTANPCTHPSWAVGTFHNDQDRFVDRNGNLNPVSDDNVEWNLHLAMLGHALHAVEDFFAHSTFIEHASAALPDNYRRLSRLEQADILARRLKEWRPGFDDSNQDWRGLPDDTHVVTGYFDFSDTLVSLGHMLDKVLDRPHQGIGHDVDQALEYDYRKLLTDTLEFVSRPAAVWDANNPDADDYDEDTANVAVKWLHEQGGSDLRLLRQSDPNLNRVITLMQGHPLLRGRPQQVKEAFADSVRKLGVLVGGARTAFTVFEALKTVRDFFLNPLGFLREFVGDTIYDRLVRYGEVYVKNLLYAYIGALRVGSHSLIAKDGDHALFYDAGMDCAKAVHWYIVTQFLRHSSHRTVFVCRSADGQESRAAMVQREWIDWLELLEYFLSYPFSTVQTQGETMQVPGNITHVTRTDPHSIMSPDSLATLAAEYRSNYLPVRGGPSELTWEMIADANFPTAGLSTRERQRRINDVLRNQPDHAALTRDNVNYAFRGGVRLVIPCQRVSVVRRRARIVRLLWWHSVIVDGWREGRDDLGHQVYSVSFEEQLRLVEEADELRSQLERAYQ